MSTTSRCMGWRRRTTRSWWRSWLRLSKLGGRHPVLQNGDVFHVEHFVVVILYVLTYTYIAGIRNNVNGLRGARLVGCGLPGGESVRRDRCRSGWDTTGRSRRPGRCVWMPTVWDGSNG